MSYRILICGAGSIGERHIRNLLSLGQKNIRIFRKRNLPLRSLKNEFEVFLDLEKALAWRPDIAYICNPTYLHASTLIECLRNGCHVFVEKPLCCSSDEIEGVRSELEKSGKLLMVGYMLRFHPCLIGIRKWITEKKIGRLIYFASEWGEYLPDWHPYEDYRKSYAALKEMGGGPTLTLSHEIDTLCWMLGVPDSFSARASFCSELELTTEHGVDVLFSYKNGVTANLHLDYFQRPPARTMKIVGTNGKIYFDYYRSRALLFCGDVPEPVDIIDLSRSFDRNQLFVDEIKWFHDCIDNGKVVEPGIEDGANVVKLAESILRKIYEKK